MAFTPLPTFVTGQTFTAANANTYWTDNFAEVWKGTTAGDIDYYTSSTAKTRIGIGTAYQALGVNAGATAPAWTSLSTITANAATVTSQAAGDTLYASSATALARLAKGTAYQVSAMNAGATAPAWTDLSTVTANKAMTASQAAGDTFYASSATALARLAKGTAGQVLKMNSGATAPEWGTAWDGTIVTKTGTQNVNTGTVTAITFNSEIADTSGWHDNVTNNTRITVDKTGLYRISCHIHYGGFSGSVTYEHSAIVRKDGSTSVFLYDRRSVVTNILDKFISTTWPPVSLTSGNYVELFLEQYSGGTRTVQTTTYFAVEYIAA